MDLSPAPLDEPAGLSAHFYISYFAFRQGAVGAEEEPKRANDDENVGFAAPES
jgi:hypothetical protein